MELTKEQLTIWRQQGMSNVEIACKTGKSVGSVNMLFSKYKIPPRRKGLPDEKADAMAQMKKEGKSTKEITEKLGVSPTTVYNYLKAAGLMPKKERDEDKKMDGPEPFIMAVQREPKITKKVYGSYRCEDITDFYLPG